MPDILRVIKKEHIILGAEQIPYRGFGSDEVTIKENGALVTKSQKRSFKLQSCGCVIESANEAGTICYGCRMEAEFLNQSLSPQQRLTPEQLDWVATACTKHSLQCSNPVCSLSGCQRHIIPAVDNQRFCLRCVQLRDSEINGTIMQIKHGVIGSRVLEFCKSLFIDSP